MLIPGRGAFYTGVAFILCGFPFANSSAQDDTLSASLKEVTIKAYETNRQLKDVPAAINYFDRTTLQMQGVNSIIGTVNTQPGARIEERSPGSYRLNIRGSSLRSPFGVRNVKVYYNNIPITDPGGHTYLNQLGAYNFGTLSIIKGPGSSVYGAGTGGVLLIEGLTESEPMDVQLDYAGGSYNYKNIFGSIRNGGDNYNGKVSFQHQSSDGYRTHSALKRDVFSWNGRFRLSDNQQVTTTFLLGNLYYQTPGALTRAEFEINPRSARPGAGAFPGAEAANASIRQQQVIAGATYSSRIVQGVENSTTLYAMFTDLRNPTIQNYGHSAEPHAGGRTVFKGSARVKSTAIQMQLGTEWQQGLSTVSIFKNAAGRADTLRSMDEIATRQGLVFAQAVADARDWTFTAGVSLNFLNVNYERFSPASTGKQVKKFGNQLAPRVALLRKLGPVNIYSSVSKGFSPPTTAELLPTGGAINIGLNPEQGTNYDIGMKGILVKNLYADVNVFYFGLANTIVQRRTAGGGDYFINAGKTSQKGVETYLSYSLAKAHRFVQSGNIWLSHTYHDFHYKEFKQLENDFSGNRIPGEPVHAISTGITCDTKTGFNGTASYLYTGKISLNDAGSASAKPYHLAAMRLGYTTYLSRKIQVQINVGADNLLNQKYSLGNDVNGFNGRYFNAAAGRNYYASLSIQARSNRAE